MTNKELTAIVNEINSMEELLSETQQIIEGLKDQIKAEMNVRNVETIDTGSEIIRWTSVISNRFDTTAFKKFSLDMYKQFTKPISSRKFSISR